MAKHDGLQYLTQAQLLELVQIGIQDSREFSKKVERYLMARDPKALAKSIKQKLNGIHRADKFLDYYDSMTMGKTLTELITSIEKELLPASPVLASECCALLEKISVKLIERSDDSSGYMGDALGNFTSIWGRAMAAEQPPVKEVVDLVFLLWQGDPYFLHTDLIPQFAKALGKAGITQLEKQLIEYAPDSEYDESLRIDALKDIADAQDDIERYIELCQPLKERDALNIAKRFIDKGYGDKALQWLKKYAPVYRDTTQNIYNEPDYVKYTVEAHLLEGEDKLAQTVRWSAFEQTLNPSYYSDYIKYVTEDELQDCKQKALLLAEKVASSSTAIHFLSAISEYELLSDYIIKNYSKLDDAYYSELRQLSKILHQSGFHLAAVLLRRVLAEGVMDRAKSKYYSYAANDLKQAKDYATHITDWKNIPDEATYWQQLHNEHKKKTSLWYELQIKMPEMFA